ncbi:MAG TPA: hypothetical protein VHD35_11535, partial [Chitinophagaceae bacterium]|nr:hypothetical protein [Chitinophagaceae bacterium]
PCGGSQARPVVPASRALRRLASNASAPIPILIGTAQGYASFLPQALLPNSLLYKTFLIFYTK